MISLAQVESWITIFCPQPQAMVFLFLFMKTDMITPILKVSGNGSTEYSINTGNYSGKMSMKPVLLADNVAYK